MGLAVTIPIDRQLGPVRLDSVDLTLTAAGDGARLAATAVAGAVVGPLALSVDGLGVALDIVPGNGLLPDLSVSPVPPRGAGVGLAAPGVASGGGYLFLSPDTGEYSGVLDLALLGVGINAVGLIQPGQTKLTNAFSTAVSCGFHDHGDSANTGLQGRINIQ